MKAKNISDIEFCIFYGTGDLAENQNGIPVINDHSKTKFIADLDYFADHFFSNPQYLKVDGKPVLILYVTRYLAGDYASMFREARAHLKERGVEVFLLADEIFWSVTTHVENSATAPGITNVPQTDRIALFDAIFAYNM